MSHFKIFFSVDIHGATSVWKKWLKVPDIYGADVLMLCGDLTGKALVPLIEQKDGSRKAFYFGQNWKLTNEEEIAKMEERLANAGVYSIRCDEKEIEKWQRDQQSVETIIERKITERLKQWLELLIEKVDTRKTQVIVMPGNDDDYSIDSVITSFREKGIVWCIDSVIEIGSIETISLAHTNPTPWNTPRETSEKGLMRMIEDLVKKLKDPHQSIFNFHCPPHGTRLDLAPHLDRNMKPVVGIGGVEYVHVGSQAIRKAIEKYQPLLGLHGHIHESSGIEKLGDSVCINPGSEYGEGILRGYVIEISDEKLVNYWKVEG